MLTLDDIISEAYTFLEFEKKFAAYNRYYSDRLKDDNLRHWQRIKENYNLTSEYLTDQEITKVFKLMMY